LLAPNALSHTPQVLPLFLSAQTTNPINQARSPLLLISVCPCLSSQSTTGLKSTRGSIYCTKLFFGIKGCRSLLCEMFMRIFFIFINYLRENSIQPQLVLFNHWLDQPGLTEYFSLRVLMVLCVFQTAKLNRCRPDWPECPIQSGCRNTDHKEMSRLFMFSYGMSSKKSHEP